MSVCFYVCDVHIYTGVCVCRLEVKFQSNLSGLIHLVFETKPQLLGWQDPSVSASPEIHEELASRCLTFLLGFQG